MNDDSYRMSHLWVTAVPRAKFLLRILFVGPITLLAMMLSSGSAGADPLTPPMSTKMQAPSSQATVTKSPFTLTAVLERSVPEGQPVTLALALYNGGTQNPVIDGSASEQASFDISVTDSAGRTVERTALGDRILTPPMGAYANVTIFIAPKQTLRYNFNLARLFDLSRPDDYTVHVSRSLWPMYEWPMDKRAAREEVPLALRPLKFRLVENSAVVSRSVEFTPPPDHQTFLYLVSPDLTRPQNEIARYRVAENGSISPALDSTSSDTPAVAGRGATAVTATPDGRYLYVCNDGDDTVSQFRIRNDGALSALSPPTVPTGHNPYQMVMDPKGRFLYVSSTPQNTLFQIGPDGTLTNAVAKPSDTGNKAEENRVVKLGDGVFNASGTIFYDVSGQPYQVGPDGRGTAPPVPAISMMSATEGASRGIAISPSGQYAFILKSTSISTSDDLIVPMRIQTNGTLISLPGVQTPHSPIRSAPGYQPFSSTSLAVDPSGRFLIAINPVFLACYRIGSNGSLTSCGEATDMGGFSSVFYASRNSLVYAVHENPGRLTAFRLDDQHGLTPVDVDLPKNLPYKARVASAVAPTPPGWSWPKDGLFMWGRLSGDELPIAKPLTATVFIKNVTSHALLLGTAGEDMALFRFSMIGPPRQPYGGLTGNGEPAVEAVPLLTAGDDLRRLSKTNGEEIILPPGGTRQYNLVLSRIADMSVAGNYTCIVSRVLPDGSLLTAPAVHVRLDDAFNFDTEWDWQNNVLSIL